MSDDTVFQNIYGHVPIELARVVRDACQFSPLFPASAALEDCAASTLVDMVMLAPSGTLERRYSLAQALRALAPDALFMVMAPKDKGGARLKQELKNFGCDVTEYARRHSRICECRKPAKLTGIDEAIAEGAPRLVEAMGFWSQPGVFSWNRLDIGSKLIVENLPPLVGRGVDLGCGYGYLARTALDSQQVKELTLMDIDRRAIDCAKRNIDDPRARFMWADLESSNMKLSNLDFVVMNPPFHDAGIEDQELGKKFIERAHAILRAGGVCWLTANQHLPYEDVLKALFKSVSLKAKADGFKIYEAVK